MAQQPDRPVRAQLTPKGVGVADAFNRLGDTLARSATRRGTTSSAANRRQLEALGALGIVVGLDDGARDRRTAPRGGKTIDPVHADAVRKMDAGRRGGIALAYAAPCGEPG